MTRHVPPETVAAVRRRYADGDSVAAILAATGIASSGVLYRCLDGRHDDGSGAPLPLPPLPRRRTRKPAGDHDVPSRRKALVDRIWRSAEAQVDQIEARLAQSGLAGEESERGARTLAIVVRTLRELTAFDAARRAEERATDPSSKTAENDKPVPRNIDDLRRELARKLQALVEERSGADLQIAGRTL